jgi:ribosomal protein L7/L12
MATKVSTEEWIEELKSISVMELSERIKALEEEFGVSATACRRLARTFPADHTCRPGRRPARRLRRRRARD